MAIPVMAGTAIHGLFFGMLLPFFRENRNPWMAVPAMTVFASAKAPDIRQILSGISSWPMSRRCPRRKSDDDDAAVIW
jgi:hypothetical protein